MAAGGLRVAAHHVDPGVVDLATALVEVHGRGDRLLGRGAAPDVAEVSRGRHLDGLGSLQQGFVETSNVNVVEELVQMIQTQRAYELNSKAIQVSDQMLQKLAQL